MPRAVGRNRAKHLPPNQPSLGPGGAGTGKFCAGWSRPCPPPHAAFRTLCPQTGQSVRSEAHYAAAVPRLARPASGGGPGKAGESAALSRWAEVKPGFPHVVRIRKDIFLRCGKCPRCRVRWGETGRSFFAKLAVSLSGRRCGAGKSCAKWPRPCPPPHAAFRTLCPQAGQSVRSEAHYAAAVPRLAQPAPGGRPSKTGRSAALSAPFFRPHFPGLPRLRPADPRGPLRAPRAKTGEIRLFCDISAFVNRICF